MSEHVAWAEAELRRAGLFDEDSDYDGMLGQAALNLVATHSHEGHSGHSSAAVAQLFDLLVNWHPLTPLTSDPAEWMEVEDGTWQSRRRPDAFSLDGGSTYYLLDEPQPWWRAWAWRHLPGGYTRWNRKHCAEPAPT